MNYNGYEIEEKNDSVVVSNVRDFNLKHILECGQCFRWKREDDGSYVGVAGKRAAKVSFNGDKLTIINANSDDFINFWYNYFDLGTDYSDIKKKLAKDEIMKKAIDFGYGIRLLRQDLWEMVISFILSANNRIPMIMKAVSEISRAYGDEINVGGISYYTFPDAERLANTEVCRLEACGGGFRCKYIVNTSRMVMDGLVDLKGLAGMTTDDARNELMKLPGVGPKVSDCILLYSGIKYDVFPTDVWVKRTMEVLYFKREASFKEIQEFARSYFGKYSGIAQQYLFYYARENKIGVDK